MENSFASDRIGTVRRGTAALVAVFSPPTLAMLLLLALVLVVFKARRAKMVKLIDQIPGPVCMPLVGNGLQINVGCKDGKCQWEASVLKSRGTLCLSAINQGGKVSRQQQMQQSI